MSPSPSAAATLMLRSRLLCTVPPVKAHVSRLLDKLGVDNRVQMALLVNDASVH